MLVVITAHPHPDRARANRALTKAITGLEGVEVRSLYDLYPDFDIDVAKEREALDRATTVVFQHPIYWYSPPALFKLWLENVLTAGYAYGDDGRALAGKRCLWVATTGGDDEGYTPAGMHGAPFEAFVAPMRQTARFCGMTWLEPFIVHGAHRIDAATLEAAATRYRERLGSLLETETTRDA